MLNPRGGIECDFTVTRLAEDRFRIVTGTAFGQHDLAWIRQHAPEDGSVLVEDVTSKLRLPRPLGAGAPGDPAAALVATRSRLPYMRAARALGRPRAVPRAARHLRGRARLGALLPDRVRLRLWDTIWEAGREQGLVAGGYKAIDSLRLEKGYRVWGADITPDGTRSRPGSASRSSSTRATSSAGRRSRRRPSPRAASAASCSTTRVPSRSARSRSGSAARSSAA